MPFSGTIILFQYGGGGWGVGGSEDKANSASDKVEVEAEFVNLFHFKPLINALNLIAPSSVSLAWGGSEVLFKVFFCGIPV